MRSLLLDVGGRNNLSREVEPLPEVVETLGGEGVVVVLPRELGLDVAARGQALEGLDDEQVANTGLVGRLVAAYGKRLMVSKSTSRKDMKRFVVSANAFSRRVGQDAFVEPLRAGRTIRGCFLVCGWELRSHGIFISEFGGPTPSQRP